MGQHKRNHVLARAHWRDQAARLVALAAADFASIWSCRSFGSMTGDVTLDDELASVTQGKAQFTATIEAFSKNRTPRGGAMNIALKAAVALQLPDNALTFRDYGVGIAQIGDPVDLPAIAGGNWETRLAFDVVCLLPPSR